VIVTVTLNPALSVRYDAEQVELGSANRVSRVRYHAGGRGLTVARLLQKFGHDVVAAGLAGGSSGELIRAELARVGVATQFTRISAESRRVVRIADDATGQVTTLEEPAPYITTEELGRLAADYRALLDGATAVVMCGSLPAGLPAETYGSLTSYAVEAGVPVILNADGGALRYGAERRPSLVLPEPGASESELMAVGAGAVVVTTDNGVRVITAGAHWQALVGSAMGEAAACELTAAARTQGERIAAPRTAGQRIVAPRPIEPTTVERITGRRDALVAGFVPGIALGWTWPDMLRHALALAYSVTADGETDLAAYEKLLPDVKVTGPRR
jgi:tagatose 6-phosphate kinase